jgi:type I restriction enzyme S subunit
MSEWREVVLGKVSTYVNRGVSPKYVDNDGIIVINQKCIRNGKINFVLARLHDKNKQIMQEKILQDNDILINSTGVGTAGRVALFKGNSSFIVDSHVSILRLDESIYPEFVFYNLRKRENELEETAEGSTGQIELKRDAIKQLEISLPPFPEQKAIAEVLSSLDDKIDLLHRQNKTLEQMAETLFRQWFVEEAGEDWEEGVISDLIAFNPRRVLVKGTIAPYLEMASLNTQTFNPAGWYDREFKSGTKFVNEDTLLARITPCLENGKTAYVTFLQENQVAWGSTEYSVSRYFCESLFWACQPMQAA